jgi:UDP-GlcNAc:undecaprenyl-phosphate/decaprenyl-phosphate GlcNAc-1-phosphate transferase
MIVLAGALAGLLAGIVLRWALTSTFASPTFQRHNHRGLTIPTAAGLIVILAVLAVETALVLIRAAGSDVGSETIPGRRLVALGGLGFALVGLLDDMTGVGQSHGFRGHLRLLLRGQLTTGGIKLFGGAAIGILVAGTLEPLSLQRVVVDGALIALCANLANLLDRAPGRLLKVVIVCFAGLLASAWTSVDLFGPAVAVGAGLALLVPDLREQLMLGDAGANVLGAALGLGLVLTTGPDVRLGALGLVLALNLASEVVSFSRVIDRVPPLRWLDRLGRLP